MKAHQPFREWSPYSPIAHRQDNYEHHCAPEIVDPKRTELLSVFDSTTDEGKKALLVSAKAVQDMYSE